PPTQNAKDRTGTQARIGIINLAAFRALCRAIRQIAHALGRQRPRKLQTLGSQQTAIEQDRIRAAGRAPDDLKRGYASEELQPPWLEVYDQIRIALEGVREGVPGRCICDDADLVDLPGAGSTTGQEDLRFGLRSDNERHATDVLVARFSVDAGLNTLCLIKLSTS